MFGKQKRLKKLFSRREQQWKQLSDKILEDLSIPTLLAIKMFIQDLRGLDAANALEITGADWMPHDEYQDGVVIVYGKFSYNVGDKVIINDEEVVLTESEAHMISSPLQVIIPMELTDDTEHQISNIKNFLHGHYNEATARMQQVMDHYENQIEEITDPNTTGDSIADYMYNALVEATQSDEPEEPLDMDLSEYSEEEKLLIELAYKNNGKTIQ